MGEVPGLGDDGELHPPYLLERPVTEKVLSDAATLDRRKAAWVEAYRATPHGPPVVPLIGYISASANFASIRK
jgi:hypothetical protein